MTMDRRMKLAQRTGQVLSVWHESVFITGIEFVLNRNKRIDL